MPEATATATATAAAASVRPPVPRLALYQQWLQAERCLQFASYEALWQWSVTDLPAFWQSVWDFFDLHSPTPHRAVLEGPPGGGAAMPGARWFPGAQLNYAQQVFRHAAAAHAAGQPALVFQNERMAAPVAMTWPELQRQVAVLAGHFTAMGVRPGDRVCAYLPNTPQAIVAFLACASVGAVWSVCSPDMGPVAVLDRFRQIAPKVLLAVDGQVWGGVAHDRRAVLREVLAGLPSVRHLVLVADVDATARASDFAAPGRAAHDWPEVIAGAPADGWAPAWLPFEHPLWVVYSSGTTGLPKPIVHGHGGIVLEALKGSLHNDVGPSYGDPGATAAHAAHAGRPGERFFWFSSTGWIMWNAQLAALLGGTSICLFDGNPGGPLAATGRPADWGTLWRFAGAAQVTWFGAGAAFFASCLKAGVQPQQQADLSRLHAVGSTGSPLSEECYQWIWAQLPQPGGRPIWLNPISGGTDFAGAFVAGNRLLPVTLGEMQCRCLGAAVEAWNEAGEPLMDEVGELVCTQPLPSMPLYFWGDEPVGADGIGPRYRDSYFDMFPGGQGRPAAWRHGDWIRLVPHPESGSVGAVIYGRSDATINRHGIRMGTAELYRAVEVQPEVLDSLVVDLEYLGRESWMPLFVVLREGLELDDALRQRLRHAIKTALSARHVPNAIFQVTAVPRTLSGKKMELPVKKLLLGADPATVLNRDAMANADSIDWYVAFARERSAGAPGSAGA
jgi:acetoacetyl-CoA synthetase